MIPNYLAAIEAAIGPAVENHLWQSTLCLVIAGLLALALRTNHARTRYGLWLAASIKFLIPFSLLVMVGSHWAGSRSALVTTTGVYVAVEEVSQPFTLPTAPAAVPLLVHTATAPTLSHLIPAIFLGLWLCGFVVVMLLWCARWLRISLIARRAVSLREGREVEALRRVEHLERIRRPILLLLSATTVEPGIFGIFQPVLMWPEGISKHLDDAHLDAILAHEVWHVRRRDNLAAAVHMLVEAIFWFHPLVWWLGTQLVEERERACDEVVLALGNERRVYAEGILKTCEFCVGSPLACVSGVTGADLKQRIVRIMTREVIHKLSNAKKLLLGLAGLAVVSTPIVMGLATAPQSLAPSQAGDMPATTPAFEVASIKPDKSSDGQHFFVRMMDSPHDGRLYATGVTLKMLLREAYGVQNSQIEGAPAWVRSERYDIEAKSDNPAEDELRRLSPEQARLLKHRMLQALLEDRFQLKLHRETKELPLYTLVVTKSGPKLQATKNSLPSPPGANGPSQSHMISRIQRGGGEMTFESVTMPALTQFLSQQLNRTVLDKTGLSGRYDFTLQWTPDENATPMLPGAGSTGQGPESPSSPESSGPSIFTALQEQLGLKLESQKGPVEILVIDHVERPSEN